MVTSSQLLRLVKSQLCFVGMGHELYNTPEVPSYWALIEFTFKHIALPWKELNGLACPPLSIPFFIYGALLGHSWPPVAYPICTFLMLYIIPAFCHRIMLACEHALALVAAILVTSWQ